MNRTPLTSLLLLAACGGSEMNPNPSDTSALVAPDLYASVLADFSPGENAGFGQAMLPDVVLGPPVPGDGGGGSLDVLSLGVGGNIVLGFGERWIVDAPGPDFVVFENAFWIKGDPTDPYAELAEVAVSMNGRDWRTFDCDRAGDGNGRWPGCAGWGVAKAYDIMQLDPLDGELTGGDLFDLADVGLTEARYIRITDIADEGAAPSAGFDLDAVGLIHLGR